MMEGGDGCGAENTAHFPDGVILCHLERACKAFLTGAGKP